MQIINNLALKEELPELSDADIITATALGLPINTCILTINGQTININDDTWNLGQDYKYTNPNSKTITFGSLSPNIKPVVKLYAIYSMTTKDIKPSTLKLQIKQANYFFGRMTELGKTDIIMLTANEFNDFVNNYSQGRKSSTIEKMTTLLCNLIKFLNIYYFPDAPISDRYLQQFQVRGTLSEYEKTAGIDKDYFDKFLQLMIKVMDDKTQSYNNRATAACAIILSQTGLRISEIMALTDDLLELISIDGSNEKSYILNVRALKDARGQEFIVNKTFCTPLMVKAYTALRDDISLSRLDNHKFLYQPNRTTSKKLPIPPEFFTTVLSQILADSRSKDFCFDSPDDNPYDNIKTQQVGDIYVAVPTTRQFRVHLCSELYYVHHVPLEFIRQFMAHLTTEMESYYVRPADNRHDEAERNEKMLKEIITGDAKLLGGRSSEINQRIQKFLDDNHFNVADDLDNIISSLKKKVAIKSKRCGYCVKGNRFMLCKDDLNTNEMYCAYDVCPNLCSVYYMADISYKDYRSCIRTYNHAHANGYYAEASKELNKLKAICRQRLAPELEDMHERMQTSRDKILAEHPELQHLEDNYDNIIKEIKTWQKKTYSIPQD